MTDWPSIVSDLLAVMPRAEIARETGAGASTLTSLLKGESTEPRFALGVSLLQLHAERVTKTARGKANRAGRKKAA